MFKRQLIFTFKGMRKENVNEAKIKMRKTKSSQMGFLDACLTLTFMLKKNLT